MEAAQSGGFVSSALHFTSSTFVAAISFFPLPLYLGGKRK